jgi:hypothetical protein
MPASSSVNPEVAQSPYDWSPIHCQEEVEFSLGMSVRGDPTFINLVRTGLAIS